MAPWRLATSRTRSLLGLRCGNCRLRIQTSEAWTLFFEQQPRLAAQSLRQAKSFSEGDARDCVAHALADASRILEEAAEAHQAKRRLEGTSGDLKVAKSTPISLPARQHIAGIVPAPSALSVESSSRLKEKASESSASAEAGLGKAFPLLSLSTESARWLRQGQSLRSALEGLPLVGSRRQRGIFEPQSPAPRVAAALNRKGIKCPQCRESGNWKPQAD